MAGGEAVTSPSNETVTQRRIPQDVALIERLRRERDQARKALQAIRELAPGSRGAYGKFVEAQKIAAEGLK